MKLEDQLLPILEVARYAPSVHNTQPWLVKLNSPSTLQITLNEQHKLQDGDPTGRQTTISLGIFVEAIAIAASNVGFELASTELNDRGTLLHFKEANVQNNSQLINLLRTRCTDRSIYSEALIDNNISQKLEAVRESHGVSAKVVTNKKIIDTIADLTSKGIGVALSSPGFRRELSSYLTLPWSRKRRGIAIRSLYIPLLLELCEPLLMRLGIGLKAESTLEKRRWESASGVVILLADGDMPKYWFEVGRTYLQVSLAIEAEGLSQATSAAIVEASNYHEDIEDKLGTNQRILALIRIGNGSSRRHYSPRVRVEDLLT